MVQTTKKKYRLALGTQVRKEDFGLLFYTMSGPRLYFLHSDKLLEPHFFNGEIALDQAVNQKSVEESISTSRISSLIKALHQLKEKGVIIEC